MTYSGLVASLPLIMPVIINISLNQIQSFEFVRHSVNYTMISYENKTYDDECAEKKVLISFLYKHLKLPCHQSWHGDNFLSYTV